jgi:hypothetical protein
MWDGVASRDPDGSVSWRPGGQAQCGFRVQQVQAWKRDRETVQTRQLLMLPVAITAFRLLADIVRAAVSRSLLPIVAIDNTRWQKLERIIEKPLWAPALSDISARNWMAYAAGE